MHFPAYRQFIVGWIGYKKRLTGMFNGKVIQNNRAILSVNFNVEIAALGLFGNDVTVECEILTALEIVIAYHKNCVLGNFLTGLLGAVAANRANGLAVGNGVLTKAHFGGKKHTAQLQRNRLGITVRYTHCLGENLCKMHNCAILVGADVPVL